MPRSRPPSVEDYLDKVTSETARATLLLLRGWIRTEIPDAEEVISYGIPTYKHRGFIVSIAAFKSHCSLFPGHTVADFAEELKGYKVSKGTIQFPHDKPPAESLVRAIARKRYDENESAKGSKVQSQ